MSLRFIFESHSAFWESTPMPASQDSFTNSPVDCKVPTTPNIACLKYVTDQRVPLTPAIQVIPKRPANSISIPSTPENNIKATPTTVEATMCFDNSNENLQDCVSSVDQIVPFTPEGDFKGRSRQGNHHVQSATSHYLHENIGSSEGDIFSIESSVFLLADSVEYYPKRSVQKRLSLTKCRNIRNDSTKTHQNLTDIQTPMCNIFGNETLKLSTSECTSQTLQGICNAQSPEYLNLPSRSETEPLEPTSAIASSLLPSVSITSDDRNEDSISINFVSVGASVHTRDEITQMRRPFYYMKTESQCFQAGNQSSQSNVSKQMKLFDGDDIFA